MVAQKKSRRVWVYVSEEDQPKLDQLVKAVGTLNEVSILTTIVSAGLKASEDLGYRLPLPLKFQIVEAGIEIPKPERIRR